MATDAFATMLKSLSDQYERDIADAVRVLAEENRKLRAQLPSLCTAGFLEHPEPPGMVTVSDIVDVKDIVASKVSSKVVADDQAFDGVTPWDPIGATSTNVAQAGDFDNPHGSASIGCGTLNAQAQKKVKALETRNRRVQREHLLLMFNMTQAREEDIKKKVVTPEELATVIETMGGGRPDRKEMCSLVTCLVSAARSMDLAPQHGGKGIEFHILMELVLMPDLIQLTGNAAGVDQLQSVLLPDKSLSPGRVSVDRKAREDLAHAFQVEDDEAFQLNVRFSSWTRAIPLMGLINSVVALSIVMSICTLGMSLDVDPEWGGWFVIEGLCTLVFLVEVAIKVYLFGANKFLYGEMRHWNYFDMIVIFIAVVDFIVSASGYSTGSTKSAILLRGLRLTRTFRLVKIMQLPIFRELSEIASGFLIGLPWLVWVTVLLSLSFYLIGIGLRQAVGPVTGQALLETCGTGDDLNRATADPKCVVHYLYGEEYFGTVMMSMYTVFRCAIGDCTTKGGRSLAVELSDGYGMQFQVSYCLGMVFVLFGLFNIITALFVEAVVTGLKYTNSQRQKAQRYESSFVRRKLQVLISRMIEIQAARKGGRKSIALEARDIELTEDDLVKIFANEQVKEILTDIDISLDENMTFTQLFDLDENGHIRLLELVSFLLRIRGETNKCDMVATWMFLQKFQARFQSLEIILLQNQAKLLKNTNQRMMSEDSMGFSKSIQPHQ